MITKTIQQNQFRELRKELPNNKEVSKVKNWDVQALESILRELQGRGCNSWEGDNGKQDN